MALYNLYYWWPDLLARPWACDFVSQRKPFAQPLLANCFYREAPLGARCDLVASLLACLGDENQRCCYLLASTPEPLVAY